MRIRIVLAITFLWLNSCNWETHEIKNGDVQVFVPENRFVELKVAMKPEDVMKAVGAPRTQESREGEEVWQYGVWRGEAPSFLKFLFSSERQPATLLEGRVVFRSGKVVNVEVIESTAKTFPTPPSTSSGAR